MSTPAAERNSALRRLPSGRPRSFRNPSRTAVSVRFHCRLSMRTDSGAPATCNEQRRRSGSARPGQTGPVERPRSAVSAFRSRHGMVSGTRPRRCRCADHPVPQCERALNEPGPRVAPSNGASRCRRFHRTTVSCDRSPRVHHPVLRSCQRRAGVSSIPSDEAHSFHGVEHDHPWQARRPGSNPSRRRLRNVDGSGRWNGN